MKPMIVFLADFKIIVIFINIWINAVLSDPRAVIYKGKVNIGLLIGAHSSAQSLCDTINVNALYNSMANVWALHMFNQRQRADGLDEIGVYIYDTCGDETVAQRQTVRLISHLFSVGNRICRQPIAYPPLIGVIFDGPAYDKSVHLLKSFNVPVITTSDESLNDHNSTNVFSVAPSLTHLSNAVVSLVKELNLQSLALVVSDEEPMFDSRYLHSSPLLSQIELNFITNYNDLSLNDETFDGFKTEKIKSDLKEQRYRRRDEILSSNTIFYLSPSEAVDLLNSLSETDTDYGMTESYSYIIVTTSDISLKMKTSNQLKPKSKLRQNVFLISPLIEKTNEYQSYFETMVSTKGDQPLIVEYKKVNEPKVPDMSVAVMTRAVWALAQAYQNLYQRHCAGNKLNCNLLTNKNLTEIMTKSVKDLNTVISDSGLKELNGVKLRFDGENKLISWRYQIMIMSSNWQTISLGTYGADTGLKMDSKLVKTILKNRVNRNKSVIKGNRNDLTNALMATNVPIFKQTVFGYNDSSSQSIEPSNLMRSSIKLQMSASSAPVGTVEDPNFVSRLQNNDSNHVMRKRYQNSLTSWLGTVWSMAILGTSVMGILITLYVQTFLLMKSCEGALRKSNQTLVISHLIAVSIAFLGSPLFVFSPTSMICCLRHTIHNITLSLLFGSQLVKAMHIRAQKSIGLGGRASRLNQFLTLFFIVGIQSALEYQKWKYEFSWISTESLPNMTKLCFTDGHEYVKSQIYIITIICLLLLMCWSARNTPFNQRDGKQAFVISLSMAFVFIVSMILILNVYDSKSNDIIISLSMNLFAFLLLLGQFIPLLLTIHKFGSLVPKSGSYADSLSTIFTSFGGSHDLMDKFSHNSSEGHKSKDYLKTKMNKIYDYQNSDNFFARVSPNCYSYGNQCKTKRNNCSLMHNPLYEGVPGFRSAYP